MSISFYRRKVIYKGFKKVKIIFVSADVSIKEEALSIGAFSFWVKPFTIDALIHEINRAIESYPLNN